MDEVCPDCHHPWGSHQGRNGGQQCVYRQSPGASCACRVMNPRVVAEDRLAAAAWNGLLGRD